MLKIFKGIYTVFRWIREFTITIVFLLFAMAFFAFVSFLNNSESKTGLPSDFYKGALRLDLAGYLADNHDEYSQLRRLMKSELGRAESEKHSVFDVVRAIRKAQEDPHITGIVLSLADFEGGDLASLRFVADALNDFKQHKPLIAVGDSYSQAQYYLASTANEIWLNKAGSVDLQGMAQRTLYYKSLFDKIDAVPHVFRVGTYKAAVEPFLRDEMSPEAKTNVTRWLNLIWQDYTDFVGKNREITQDKVFPAFNDYLAAYQKVQGNEAEYALQNKLVTHIATAAEMRVMLQEKFGKNKEGHYSFVSYQDYADTLTDRFHLDTEHKIAVINVEGAIVSGESDEQSAGSISIVKQINATRRDKSVKGILLRVNSPGGSAVASELIRQELETAQKQGLPVVVSMGGMAASGGYWISATADKIIASPATITGSIGIFGLALTFEKTAKNLGVSQDGVATSPLAELSAFKTLTTEQSQFLQSSVEYGYQRFIQLVANGRKLAKNDVEKVAQGQVWLGSEAYHYGLVDELGDFDVAYRVLSDLINERRKANNQEEVAFFPAQWFIEEETSFWSSLMRDMKLQLAFQLKSWLGVPFNLVENTFSPLSQFNDPKQLYLFCESCGKIN